MKTLLKFAPKMRMMCADMRKKPTNITLSDEIKHRAAHVMQRRGFSSLSAFVEDLIRDAWERATTPHIFHEAPPIKPFSSTPAQQTAEAQIVAAVAQEVSYRKSKRKKSSK